MPAETPALNDAAPALPAGVVLRLVGVSKGFTMHLQGGRRLPVVRGASFEVRAGEVVVLGGASGAGKSSLLRVVSGNYRCDEGAVLLRDGEAVVDVGRAAPRRVLRLRERAVGSVGQFLRVVPRVPALDVVAEAARAGGAAPEAADATARALLARLNLPERLWDLPPATFSGGERQRVNVARGFAGPHALLLLDEPTASLDAANREAVILLVEERRAMGGAVLAVFHDAALTARLADRVVDVGAFGAGEGGEGASVMEAAE